MDVIFRPNYMYISDRIKKKARYFEKLGVFIARYKKIYISVYTRAGRKKNL